MALAVLSAAAGAQSPQLAGAVTPAARAGSVTVNGAGRAETGPQHKGSGDAVGPQGYYELEAGDTVTVSFRFTPEFNDEVVIGPDGRATLKSTGAVKLAGMTLPEVERMIVRDSSTRLVNPEVTVSLKDYQRPQVVVAGEVITPGHFELRRTMTATQALLMAGGPKDDADLGKVILFRKINSEYAEVHVLQLGRYDAHTRAKNDMVLQPDDMLLVRHDLVSKIDRYVKLINLGVYLNPIGNNGLF
jgi:polysaccharide export outer membrane protein